MVDVDIYVINDEEYYLMAEEVIKVAKAFNDKQ